MKVIILAGGFGTRLSEYTESIPKPMVTIGGKPILWHVMQRYVAFDHKDFYIALGYKAETIKEYFLTFGAINSDFSLDLSTGKIKIHNIAPIILINFASFGFIYIINRLNLLSID